MNSKKAKAQRRQSRLAEWERLFPGQTPGDVWWALSPPRRSPGPGRPFRDAEGHVLCSVSGRPIMGAHIHVLSFTDDAPIATLCCSHWYTEIGQSACEGMSGVDVAAIA